MEVEMDNNSIGKRLSLLMERKETNVKLLAEKLGCSMTLASMYKNGKRIPNDEKLKQLSEIFQVNYHWLKTGMIDYRDVPDKYFATDEEIFENEKQQDILDLIELKDKIKEFLPQDQLKIQKYLEFKQPISKDEWHLLNTFNELTESSQEEFIEFINNMPIPIANITKGSKKLFSYFTLKQLFFELDNRKDTDNSYVSEVNLGIYRDVKNEIEMWIEDNKESLLECYSDESKFNVDMIQETLGSFITFNDNDWQVLIVNEMLNPSNSNVTLNETKEQNPMWRYFNNYLKRLSMLEKK
jgi:transcriptional regulator with XRE-family HTH domain